jgi:hypothetical protein
VQILLSSLEPGSPLHKYPESLADREFNIFYDTGTLVVTCAKNNDRVHRFYSGSKGLTSPEYLKQGDRPKGLRMFAAQCNECAVCIPDGAKLILSGISSAVQQARGLSATETVMFRQLSADAATYRDAVEFNNGIKLRLQDLEEGQPVEVLALSSEEADAQERRAPRFV